MGDGPLQHWWLRELPARMLPAVYPYVGSNQLRKKQTAPDANTDIQWLAARQSACVTPACRATIR